MFRIAVFVKTSVYAPSDVGNPGANRASNYETLAAAKSAVSTHITNNKSTYSNGYTAYVIDQDTNRVVSVATVPEPTLEWKDLK